MFTCRCCVGTEPPEKAEGMLEEGWFYPNCSSDIWALGQLMLETAGGQRPTAHTACLNDDFLDDQADGKDYLSSQHIHDYYLYLQQLLGQGQLDYAEQVTADCLAVAQPDCISNMECFTSGPIVSCSRAAFSLQVHALDAICRGLEGCSCLCCCPAGNTPPGCGLGKQGWPAAAAGHQKLPEVKCRRAAVSKACARGSAQYHEAGGLDRQSK